MKSCKKGYKLVCRKVLVSEKTKGRVGHNRRVYTVCKKGPKGKRCRAKNAALRAKRRTWDNKHSWSPTH